MNQLISTINEIVRYGLQPNVTGADHEKLLERHLVKIYDLYFDIDFKIDEREFPDFDISNYPNIRQNVARNFPDFGLYKTILDVNDLNTFKDVGTGDAIDDLSEIISDLLELRWRIENNSLADGLSYFERIFRSHTQQHMLDLLAYMKSKNG